MKWSQTPIQTLREKPVASSIESHSLLLRGGYIHQLSAGLFTYAPFMVRAISKFEKIIRDELEKEGMVEIYMPMVQPKEIWEETDRWSSFSEILQTMKNRSGKEFCLGPTHEEVVTKYVKAQVKSYRDLPFGVYQIQTKYRDEYRPRFGLLRAREFGMKDAYSFDLDEKASLDSFQKMEKAYHRIFSKLKVKYHVVQADSGAIGGSHSKEFHIIADEGEDQLYISKDGKEAFNKEVLEKKNITDLSNFDQHKGIEVAHIFHLGTKYSKIMKAEYLSDKGRPVPIEMGCYGIGTSRTIQAIVEQSHDSAGIIWPFSVSPFQVHICALGYTTSDKVREWSHKIYDSLWAQGIDVFLDDRKEPPGVKFKDADLLGLPLRITIGEKDLKENQIELVERKSGQKVKCSADQVESLIRKYQKA